MCLEVGFGEFLKVVLTGEQKTYLGGFSKGGLGVGGNYGFFNS